MSGSEKQPRRDSAEILAAQHVDFVTRIFEIYHAKAKDDVPAVQHLRARHVVALAALAELIPVVLDDDGMECVEAREALMHLASALQDLSLGIVHPLLQPAEISNRRPDPTAVWIARAHVVLAVEHLIESGETRKAATRRIASFFSKSGLMRLLRAEGASPETSIIGWINEFRDKHSHTNPVALAVYRRELEAIKAGAVVPAHGVAFSHVERAELLANGLPLN